MSPTKIGELQLLGPIGPLIRIGANDTWQTVENMTQPVDKIIQPVLILFEGICFHLRCTPYTALLADILYLQA